MVIHLSKNKYIKYFNVVGESIEINSDLVITKNTFDSKLSLFESTYSSENANIVVNHHFYIPNRLSELIDTDSICTKTVWTVFKTYRSIIFRRVFTIKDNNVVTIFLEILKNKLEFSIYCDGISKNMYATGKFSSLTLFSGDQILFTWILAQKGGCLLHANSFAIANTGFLVCGQSGAGKSTLCSMLKSHSVDILGDDRAVIKTKSNNITIEGTWLHGSEADFSNTSTSLGAIYFLNKSAVNEIVLIKDKDKIVQNLLSSLVRPFLLVKGWNKVFKTMDIIVRNIPCYTLSFDTSGKIVKTIKRHTYGYTS